MWFYLIKLGLMLPLFAVAYAFANVLVRALHAENYGMIGLSTTVLTLVFLLLTQIALS